MRKQNYTSILTLLIPITFAFLAHASGPRSAATRLTDDEARILLYVTPAAVSARRTGTDVDVERSEPTKQFPAADYFVAAIVSRRPTGVSALGNGLLGYFAVDKRTADVESNVDFTPVKGKELGRVQGWMRHEHCILIQHSKKQLLLGRY